MWNCLRWILCLVAVATIAQVDLSAASLTGSTLGPSGHALLYLLVFGAALGTGNLTLADQAKRTDPTGRAADIVELLSQTNEMLDDMTWKEGNLETGNRTTVRTSLPTVSWRMVNQGVVPSKSTTAQIDDQASMLEAWSEVDTEVLKLNGNTAATRLSEARAFIEAMNQEVQQTLFYGNGGLAPEEFTGFTPRYNLSTATNGENVIKAGGVDVDNTSAWLIAWSDETVGGLFPKGSTAGLQHNDYGEVTVEMIAGLPGSRMRAMQERWQWKCGLMVKDWRYVVRVCNLDVSLMNGGTTVNLIGLMEQAEETIPNRLGKPIWYMNRTTRRYLRKLARSQVGTGGGLTFENFAGRRILMFGDTPIRTVDALLNNEALVV